LIDIGRYMRETNVELGQLKMTLAKFYRVTGSSTQRLGVAPDISFPSPYTGEEFGEASRPNALPWDEIATSSFKPTNQISPKMIASLQQLYLKHLSEDEDLVQLQKDIEKAVAQRDKTSISLNYEERKKASQVDDTPTVDDMSTTIEESEVLSDETEESKLSDDPYLKEGMKLLAELAKRRIG
jgi:carboxyl-terminal processing protease